MKKLFYSLSIATVLVACGPDENTILYNQVMDIHDEMMPKMEELYNKKKKLQEQLETEFGSKSTVLPTTSSASKKAYIEEKIAEIDGADKLMMDWMHDFNPPEKGADKAQTKAYLEAELVKVKAVREAMVNALK